MVLVSTILAVSVLILPWWVSVLSAGVLATQRGALPLLVAAGLLLDTWYGAPIAALGGLHYVYTILFTLMGVVASIVRTRVIE